LRERKAAKSSQPAGADLIGFEQARVRPLRKESNFRT